MTKEKFIKIMEAYEWGDDKHLTVQTELIPVSRLVKIYKDCGSDGTGIVFEVDRDGKHKPTHWAIEWDRACIRDEVFEKYEKLLCGEIIDMHTDLIKRYGGEKE